MFIVLNDKYFDIFFILLGLIKKVEKIAINFVNRLFNYFFIIISNIYLIILTLLILLIIQSIQIFLFILLLTNICLINSMEL